MSSSPLLLGREPDIGLAMQNELALRSCQDVHIPEFIVKDPEAED